MRIPKRIALTLSGLAFAGATALTLGAAAPTGAQTISSAPHTAAVHHWGFGGCGWNDCWDDCWGDCGDWWW